MRFGIDLSYWAYQTVAMLLTCFLIPKLKVDGIFPALTTVLVLAFINSHLWSAALFFEIPDTMTHRTITLLISNGVIFWIVVKLLPGIEIEGFLPAIIAPIVFTVTSILIGIYAPMVDWNKVTDEALRFIGETKSYVEQTKDELKKPETDYRQIREVPGQ